MPAHTVYELGHSQNLLECGQHQLFDGVQGIQHLLLDAVDQLQCMSQHSIVLLGQLRLQLLSAQSAVAVTVLAEALICRSLNSHHSAVGHCSLMWRINSCLLSTCMLSCMYKRQRKYLVGTCLHTHSRLWSLSTHTTRVYLCMHSVYSTADVQVPA